MWQIPFFSFKQNRICILFLITTQILNVKQILSKSKRIKTVFFCHLSFARLKWAWAFAYSISSVNSSTTCLFTNGSAIVYNMIFMLVEMLSGIFVTVFYWLNGMLTRRFCSRAVDVIQSQCFMKHSQCSLLRIWSIRFKKVWLIRSQSVDEPTTVFAWNPFYVTQNQNKWRRLGIKSRQISHLIHILMNIIIRKKSVSRPFEFISSFFSPL